MIIQTYNYCNFNRFRLWLEMTLTQLKIFIAVAELGNVTKASQELGISQSAASAAIATIENIYQVSFLTGLDVQFFSQN